jgi:NAD(P)-dependent dehydrogenase (short-subunit alcohol dehydrogenase family)
MSSATQLLARKTAVVYGGGGAIGGASARVFAREIARVFLAGRTQAKLEAVARDIESAGGSAADIMMIMVLRALRHTRMVSDIPALRAYRDRCEARPAFQRALRAQLDSFTPPRNS